MRGVPEGFLRRAVGGVMLAALVTGGSVAHADFGLERVKVLTQNQYLGADLAPILAAGSPAEFNEAALAALAQVAANNFPERVRVLARQIAFTRPHFVGLQEVFDFTLNGQNGAPPFRNHLADTLDALEAFGADYVVVAQIENFGADLPVDVNGDGTPDAVVGVFDSDVILVRGDIAETATAVPYSSVCARPAADGGPGCHYQVTVVADSPAGPLDILRGFIGVDATVGGVDYRFVNTHLEVQLPDPTNPLSAAVQAFQAAELLATVAATPDALGLIVVGDINSSPEDPVIGTPPDVIVPPYQQFLAAGLIDAWTERFFDTPGFTCCQDADLRNRRSALDQRIDVVFSREDPWRVRARRLGASPFSKTFPLRLWPSDHAAVLATMVFADGAVAASHDD